MIYCFFYSALLAAICLDSPEHFEKIDIGFGSAAHHYANQSCACAFIKMDKPYELMIQKHMRDQSRQAHTAHKHD